MNYVDISDKDRQAVEKKELDEHEQRRLRGTGYDMMKNRDVGIGWIHNERIEGRPVEIAWPVDGEKRVPYQTMVSSTGQRIEVFAPRIEKGKFKLTIGAEEAVIDAEAFRKLFRWV